VLFTVPYVFPTRYYQFSPVCVYYALSVSSQALPLLSCLCCLLYPECFLTDTSITTESELFTVPCVFPPSHHHYSPVCTIYCTLCFLPDTTITVQSALFTMPRVFPPRHYHYSPVCAVYYALSVSYQTLPLLSSLCCLLFPVFPTRHQHYNRVCTIYCTLCVSVQTLPLLSSLCCLLCPECFLPGTTITLQSVLFTMPWVFPPRHYHFSPVCAVYYTLSVSSQTLPLLSSLCCLLCPVCFLPDNTTTLQSVLFTIPWVFPPRHYHYSPVCAVYYTLSVSSQALALQQVCTIYDTLRVSSQTLPLLSSLCCLLCPRCFFPGTSITTVCTIY
jgi:hypothetical protein